MLVLHNPTTLLHKTKEIIGSRLIDALECPERIAAIVKAVSEDEKHDLCVVDGRGERVGRLLEVCLRGTHDAGYLDHLKTIFARQLESGLVEGDGCVLPECFRMPRGATGSMGLTAPRDVFARAGYYAFDMSSGISKHSYTSILASASLAIEGAIRITQGHPTITSLCRPPGHHCDTKTAGGYCYINNAVLAVQALTHLHNPPPHPNKPSSNPSSHSEHPKIAILDIDFHHGNGTQDFFYDSADVLYVSVHGEDEYPYYSGNARETGRGAGQGFNKNYPLPSRSSADEYLGTVRDAVREIKVFGPGYLVISLGFDTFHLDPLGSFKLETGDYRRVAWSIRREVDVPCLILLEGGYVVEDLGGNLVAFLDGWENAERGDDA